MQKIATLGPSGTFSDAATSKYASTLNEPFEVVYFQSIVSAFKSIGTTCEVGVLPIENFSEGFIPLVLDLLVDAELEIVSEIMLPIQFSFVSNTHELSKINKLFVQFVAKGQCSVFIESLNDIEIVTTESNIESLEQVQFFANNNAAIVPSGSFSLSDFSCVVENINDYEKNQTRFLVLRSNNKAPQLTKENDYKTSIVVLDDKDHSGLLGEILNSFSKRKVNLTSIISRPTCREFGKYHFFIDLDGAVNDLAISEALEEISKMNKVKILGSYPKARYSD